MTGPGSNSSTWWNVGMDSGVRPTGGPVLGCAPEGLGDFGRCLDFTEAQCPQLFNGGNDAYSAPHIVLSPFQVASTLILTTSL